MYILYTHFCVVFFSFFLYILYHIFIKNTKFDLCEIFARYILSHNYIFYPITVPFHTISTLPNIPICQPMSRRWLLLVCTVTYLYVARLVPPIYKALPGTSPMPYIFTYLTYPYTVYVLPTLFPYILIYLFTPIPLLYTY